MYNLSYLHVSQAGDITLDNLSYLHVGQAGDILYTVYVTYMWVKLVTLPYTI